MSHWLIAYNRLEATLSRTRRTDHLRTAVNLLIGPYSNVTAPCKGYVTDCIVETAASGANIFGLSGLFRLNDQPSGLFAKRPVLAEKRILYGACFSHLGDIQQSLAHLNIAPCDHEDPQLIMHYLLTSLSTASYHNAAALTSRLLEENSRLFQQGLNGLAQLSTPWLAAAIEAYRSDGELVHLSQVIGIFTQRYAAPAPFMPGYAVVAALARPSRSLVSAPVHPSALALASPWVAP